jgi:hypothetical protein
MKDTIQGNQVMVVVGGGDAAGRKHNNQIEATTAVVGTVGAKFDGGEVRAKGEMSRWRTMRVDWAAEDAMGGGGRQRKAIGWQRTQQEEGADGTRQSGGRGRSERRGRTMQGDWVLDDTKRGKGQTPRTQRSGR